MVSIDTITATFTGARRSAYSFDLGDLIVKVCSLDDLIATKRAARPKDLIEVEFLAALRDEINSTAPPSAP